MRNSQNPREGRKLIQFQKVKYLSVLVELSSFNILSITLGKLEYKRKLQKDGFLNLKNK